MIDSWSKGKSKRELDSIKEQKVDLSELIENKQDGKLDNHKDGNTENQQSNHMGINTNKNPINRTSNQSFRKIFFAEGDHSIKIKTIISECEKKNGIGC